MRRLSSALLILAGAVTFVVAAGAGANGQIPGVPLLTTTTTALITLPVIGEVTVPALEITTTTVHTSDPVTTVSSVVGSTVSTVTSVVDGVVSPVTTVTAPGGGTVGGVVEDVVDCTSFATQTAAQTAMKLDPSLGAILDSDRDGVACELLPIGSPVTTAPGAGTGATGGSGGTGGSGVGVRSGSGSVTAAGGGSPVGLPTMTTGEKARDGAASAFDRTAPLRRGAVGAAGPRGVQLSQQERLVGDSAAASSPLGGLQDGEGIRYFAWKVIAFVLLLAVTATAAARREELLAAV